MRIRNFLSSIFVLALLIGLYFYSENTFKEESINIEGLPEYSGSDYIIINNNEPIFDDYSSTQFFEKYSELDNLNRAGVAEANLSIDMKTKKKRESIGMIKPSGWHTVKYDIVEDNYLYNRCHLIAYQFTGQNANEKNLITCTKYMNSVSMLKFENMVGNYIRRTGNHVLYRVTPIYYKDNLLASGVNMEAYSVEDKGEGIKFNVFVYNIQEGIYIDYKTGESRLEDE